MAARASRRRLAPALALGASCSALFIGALVASGWLGACRPIEGPSGVHASISLASSGWADTDMFDHITVTATSGDQSAVVCFATNQAFEQPRDAGTAATDPCADDPQIAWTSVPTVADWHLDAGARTANFAFAENAGVTVTAEAHLGGSPAIGRATMNAASVIGGSSIDLALVKIAPDAAAPVCDVELGQTLPGDAGTSTVCGASLPGCFCTSEPNVPRPGDGCTGTLAGVACGATLSTIHPRSTFPSCGGVHDVIRGAVPSAGLSRTTCISAGTSVRLFRCAEGDDGGTCTPTADCTPPPISFVVRKPSTGAVLKEIPFGCVPPTVFPIPIRLTVNADESLLAAWIGLSAVHTDDARACSLEFTPVVVVTDCSAR